jgi:hypothetical protein
MGKEILVEATKLQKEFTTTTQSGTTGPEYLTLVIILTFVTLYAREYSTTAEWITEVVDKTSRSTSILKLITLGIGQELRRYGGDIAIFIEHLNKRLPPIWRNLNIGVKQQDILRLHLL